MRVGAVFLGYAACLAILSWPLAAAMSTHLPNPANIFMSDTYYAGWALAWQTHALMTDPTRFGDATIYDGTSRALFYGTPGFGLLPIFGPVFAVSANPTLALNVAVLGSLAATATSLHLVVAAWTGSRLVGVAAASTFITAPAALGLCAMFPQYTGLAGIPLIAWLLARDRLEWRGAIALATLVAIQALTDVLYVAFPVMLTVALAAGVRLLRERSRNDGWRIVAALVAAIAALAPVYAQFLGVRAANPDLRTQSVWTTGRQLLMNLGTWLPAGPAPLAIDVVVFAPAVLGVLAAAFVLRDGGPAGWRPWRQAALWFFTSLAISWVLPLLVPEFRSVLGAANVREVTRLGFPALIGACLLAGLGFAACTAVLRRRASGVVASVLSTALLVVWVVTRLVHFPREIGAYPIVRAPTPGAETAVLRLGRGHVLELPIGPLTDTTRTPSRCIGAPATGVRS